MLTCQAAIATIQRLIVKRLHHVVVVLLVIIDLIVCNSRVLQSSLLDELLLLRAGTFGSASEGFGGALRAI